MTLKEAIESGKTFEFKGCPVTVSPPPRFKTVSPPPRFKNVQDFKEFLKGYNTDALVKIMLASFQVVSEPKVIYVNEYKDLLDGHDNALGGTFKSKSDARDAAGRISDSYGYVRTIKFIEVME